MRDNYSLSKELDYLFLDLLDKFSK